jgi:DNA-binding transcriptional regulator GbsR (MarR family)
MKEKSLSQVELRFILHWGQMGTEWGINRTVAQIHALLFLAERPLHAEDICDILQVARSNVSNSLKELQGWGIVHKVPVLGDKRDHFESVHDVWELARIIAAERKKREIDPTIQVLNECVKEAKTDADTSDTTHKRLKEMADFLKTTGAAFERVNHLPTPALKSMIKLAGKGLRSG